MSRFTTPVVVLLALTFVSLGAQPAIAAPLPDGACGYVTAISASNPGSDAAKYAVFERDFREASLAAGHDVRRTVRCMPTKIDVELLQYGLPIKPPKKVTAVYDAFAVDASGRVTTFAVNRARRRG